MLIIPQAGYPIIKRLFEPKTASVSPLPDGKSNPGGASVAIVDGANDDSRVASAPPVVLEDEVLVAEEDSSEVLTTDDGKKYKIMVNDASCDEDKIADIT